MIRRKAPFGRIFGVPALLAVVSLVGLVVGLLGDDGYDAAAGAVMAVPVAVMAWSLLRARRGGWDR